jgi:hypothetical protein
MEREKLEKIYKKGIERTHWKSTMLVENLNPLRDLLGLNPREEALEKNQYDKEVVDVLRSIDFHELDGDYLSFSVCCIGMHNMTKCFVLNFSWCGLEDAGDASTHEA